MTPTIGRIVHYRLSMRDVAEISARRASMSGGTSIFEALSKDSNVFRGNAVEEGNTFPAMIVRVWGDAPTSAVQLQVFLDGNDQHWAASVAVGEGPGTWSWPPRVDEKTARP